MRAHRSLPLSPSSYFLPFHSIPFHPKPSHSNIPPLITVLPKMGHFRRRIAIVLLIFLLAATLAARCDGSRSMHTSYVKPRSTSTAAMSSGRLFGYLPRAKLIPPSGPSEGHNSIGPEGEGELINKP